MRHLGDYAPATALYFMFTTYRPSTGANYTLAGTPVVRVYKNGSTTQHTTTYAVTADFDTVTGLNYFTIDTSADGTFYAAGGQFTCVLEAGTVDSVSVVGTVVGTFSLNATAALRPTTAGRTLDVSAGGEAGVDWANVGSPTTTLALTGTTIATTQKVDVETIKTQTVTCGAGVTVLASVGTAATSTAQTGDSYALANGANGFVAIKGDTAAILADTGTDGVVVAAGSKTGYSLSATQTFDLTGSITGNLSGSVGSVTGAVGSVTGAVGSVTSAVTVGTNNDKTGYSLTDSPGIKKNAALAAFQFLMVDSADHVTPKTGLTITATRSLDGAAFAACANAVAELSNGIYNIDLAAGDLNGTVVTLRFTATGADDRLITIVTET